MASQQSSNPFPVLASRRGRYALEGLQDADLPMPMDALARTIVARERGEPDAEVDEERLERCLEALYHDYLPRLDAAGAIEVDWDRLTVTDVGAVPPSTFDADRR